MLLWPLLFWNAVLFGALEAPRPRPPVTGDRHDPAKTAAEISLRRRNFLDGC